MKIVSKVFNIIGNILFYIFLACVIAYVVGMACGIHPFITMSGSMEPSIHTGSLCIVDTKATYDEIEVGDVIAFRISTGALVTHRVISITDEGLETQGDANDISDGISTTTENFYGETIFSIPYMGYAMAWLNELQNKLIVIVIALMFLVLGHIDSFIKDDDTKEEKKQEELVEEASESEEDTKQENTKTVNQDNPVS